MSKLLTKSARLTKFGFFLYKCRVPRSCYLDFASLENFFSDRTMKLQINKEKPQFRKPKTLYIV